MHISNIFVVENNTVQVYIEEESCYYLLYWSGDQLASNFVSVRSQFPSVMGLIFAHANSRLAMDRLMAVVN